jgi:alpha-amylase
LAYAFILTTEGYPFVYHQDYSTEPGCYGLKPWIDNLVWIHENLAAGSTVTRHADAPTVVYERQGSPGLLTAIGKDPWNPRTITCATNFGAGIDLHDYTGRHPDIRTDGDGQATFTVPSNAFGSGQSYLCFSRPGRAPAPAVESRRTTQCFFAADDLEIAPARDGRAAVGRVWTAQGTPVGAVFSAERAPLPPNASIVVELLDPTATRLASAEVGSNGAAELRAMATRAGWHSFTVTGGNLPSAGGVPFALTVTYTATQELRSG